MNIPLIMLGIAASAIAGFTIHSILRRAARPMPVRVRIRSRHRK